MNPVTHLGRGIRDEGYFGDGGMGSTGSASTGLSLAGKCPKLLWGRRPQLLAAALQTQRPCTTKGLFWWFVLVLVFYILCFLRQP